ncbi:MAG TPA: preprotein translocase subunit SecG [Chloroflexi bacterium]|nr:MAG: preprotein translocase subunit SecG [Anaerolineaceae bacterium 4572_5.2]HEY83770.1 preprotein translocase subunit SecG [Chloroflexota bacterium]
MIVALQIVQIIISITLIALVLLQGKSGGLGGIFGGDGGVYRTRRGVEKLVFQATIGVSAAFFLVSILIVVLPG